ncbi:GNAT family N-acetyltransferase [Tissierella sp. Yu-01]|uniref:GNAT family N-acetyltransferase n=1 Tax=Tissierella sp. Yu-01 TaxID=3035694 RepID=UPI00240E1287|nr:GNAT family N-acetyltransferase [Tissierella sp. Yu-01]WFA09460.1 GNAT family N-acetyltransferase [Tissierella sp. Yu-01]
MELVHSKVIIKKAIDKNEIEDFIKLPFKLYKGENAWVPPLKSDFKKYINGENNMLNEVGPNVKLVAYRDGKVAGRLLVGINNHLNNAKGFKEGYISLFESINDEEVAFSLLNFAENWLKEKDMDIIKGPLSLPGGDDNRGFLIDNFKDPTLIMNTYNKEYYNELFISYGFDKYYDCYAYKTDFSNENIDRYEKIVPYAMKKHKFKVERLDLKNIEKEMRDIKLIINKAMPKEWDDFIPLDDSEIEIIAKQLVPFADPDLIYIARNLEGEPIGFNITLPDYNQVLKKLNGMLFPFGIFKFLYYKRKIDMARFFVLFVIPEYRKKGVPSAIYLESFKKAKEKGYKFVEGSTIWEYNTEMKNDIERFGGELYKTYRIYKKSIFK